MPPLFPFIAGLAAGAAALSLYKNQNTRDSLNGLKAKLKHQSAQAQETLREAAVSGLSTLESSSVRLRDRLQAEPGAPTTAGKKTTAAAAKKAVPRPRQRAAAKSAAATKKSAK